MNEMKIRRMRRRNSSRRANVRRARLNALQTRITRAHDERNDIDARIASREIVDSLIDVLNAFSKWSR